MRNDLASHCDGSEISRIQPTEGTKEKDLSSQTLAVERCRLGEGTGASTAEVGTSADRASGGLVATVVPFRDSRWSS